MTSRRIFAAPALLCAFIVPAYAQTGSPKTAAQLNAEINARITSNGKQQVTAADLRQVWLDFVSSIIPDAPNYYVTTSGNDSNSCITPATPCLTLQVAWNKIAVANHGAGGVVLNIADGTYSAGFTANGAWTGAGPIAITGNIGSPGNVIINAGAANAFSIQNAAVTLNGMELRTTTSHAGLVVSRGGDVSFSNLRFGGDGTGNHMTVTNGGRIHCVGNYQIVSGGESHIHSANRGYFDAPSGGCTATLTGVYNFTAYFAGTSDGDINFTGWTPSGTATGQKFFSHDGARIQTGGLGLSGLPGSIPGSLRVLGQYDNFFGGPNAQITGNDNAVDGPAPTLASQFQAVAVDGGFGGFTANAFANQTHFTGEVAFGTAASKSAVSSTFPVVSLIGRAFDGSAMGGVANIDINTIAGVTPSDHGGYIVLRTAPAGSPSLTEQMTIGKGAGGATIGIGVNPEGPGTLNLASALYVRDVKIIDNDAWPSYSPAVASNTVGGTPATYAVNSARYKCLGKVCNVKVDVSVINQGVGAGGTIDIDLPFAAAALAGTPGSSYEYQLFGKSGSCYVGNAATTMKCADSTNTTYIATGKAIVGSVTYEIP